MFQQHEVSVFIEPPFSNSFRLKIFNSNSSVRLLTRKALVNLYFANKTGYDFSNQDKILAFVTFTDIIFNDLIIQESKVL